MTAVCGLNDNDFLVLNPHFATQGLLTPSSDGNFSVVAFTELHRIAPLQLQERKARGRPAQAVAGYFTAPGLRRADLIGAVVAVVVASKLAKPTHRLAAPHCPWRVPRCVFRGSRQLRNAPAASAESAWGMHTKTWIGGLISYDATVDELFRSATLRAVSH
jgi:hypothetical protein